jgi:hypothetical protein
MPPDVGFLMTATRFFRVALRNAVIQSQYAATLHRDEAQRRRCGEARRARCNQQRPKCPDFEILFFLVSNLLRRKQKATAPQTANEREENARCGLVRSQMRSSRNKPQIHSRGLASVKIVDGTLGAADSSRRLCFFLPIFRASRESKAARS